ncbi:hypothetical protein MPH_01787 [Macrophomina phaseolina MS6]|uniref:Uncharacterized protein n=1 Tax=Macrophomina phaseolina (strain MS6) TaxID=1126212 RepID=K2S1M4_MACPH|nr:hypothetical protein MPH_01787 [Macrophomina phaseolina MS6]
MKLFASVLLLSTVIAHPGPDHPVSHSELQRRAAVSKRCAPQVAQFNEKRYNARLRKRALDLEERGNTTYQITTEAPYYDVIQNDTCVLTPEVTQGPYVWPRYAISPLYPTPVSLYSPVWPADQGLFEQLADTPPRHERRRGGRTALAGRRSHRHQHLRAAAKCIGQLLALQCHW